MKDALALALVHFLWQGIVIGALGWGLMRFGHSAAVRYTIGVATLAAMLAAPVLTMLVLAPDVAPVTADTTAAPVAVTAPMANAALTPASTPARTPLALPAVPSTWILTAWLIGVSVLSARVAGGWVVARRLVTVSITPVSREIEDLATALAQRLGLRRIVRVLSSSRAAVPVMVGWWRPVVLIPASAVSGMPLSQIEALLAHEFAHIRRHDYLVNLLQTMVETVCFYHPIVWWMSREVRRERELCCDDIAVGLCDRVTYVSALAHVASLATPRLAMAANGGSLRDRVSRLVSPGYSSRSSRSGWTAFLPVLLVVALAASYPLGARTPTQTVDRLPVDQPLQTREVVQPATQVRPARPANGQSPSADDIRKVRDADQAVRDKLSQRLALLQAELRAERRTQNAQQLADPTYLGNMKLTLSNNLATASRQREEAEREYNNLKDMKLDDPGIDGFLPMKDPLVQALKREVTTLKSNLAKQMKENGWRDNHPQVVNHLASIEAKEAELADARSLVVQQLKRAMESAQSMERAAQKSLDLVQSQLEGLEPRRSTLRADTSVLEKQIARVDARIAQHEDQLLRFAMVPLALASTLRPRDVLTIVISGESQLPRDFEVSSSGNIRFPLLGEIRVEGLTAAAVQANIAQLLAAKGLGSSPKVTVSAAGPRSR